MRANIAPMVTVGRSVAKFGVWDQIASGVGYHLDNFGRWLIDNAPRTGSIYATLLAPNAPRPRPKAGWRFAGEYYEQRLWMACRRGALWEAAKKLDPALPLLMPWYDGMIVDVTLGNDNSLCLYVCGSFEPNEFSFLDGFLKPGMIFVDVGANDGYFSLFAARRVGTTGGVVAIEPSTRERINLRRNLVRNGFENIRIVSAALGAAPGEADLQLAQSSHSGHNTLGRFAYDDVKAANVERVTLKTLDQVAKELGLSRIDFIKIDVEGAEASVVAGARSVLTSLRPLMLLEINDRALSAQGATAQTLLNCLQSDFSYEILTFSPSTGLLEPASQSGVLSANIVAVPRERLAEARAAA
jgi:FkbM family methyltransferase